MKVFVNGMEFESKKELKKFIKKKLNNVAGEHRLLYDKDFFLNLIKKHPDFDTKFNTKEIEHFFVRPNRFNKDTLFVKFKDGTMTDVSWVKCITGKGQDYETKLTIAMRSSIEYQIFSYKKSLMSSLKICHICGEKINSAFDLHVDHVVKFKDLKRHFLNINKIDIPKDFENKIGYNFMDCDLDFCESWQFFHRDNSILAPTHAECNLSRK